MNTIKGYNTQKNDIWSLGVILINLTAGRNPWKQANLKNATFAAYVRNPRHFFKTILPCISDELEKILLRILCLNPARRISLPELRVYIQKCQSFVQQPEIEPKKKCSANSLQQKIRKRSIPYTHHPYYTVPKNIHYSHSTAETMLHYVGSFTDDEEFHYI